MLHLAVECGTPEVVAELAKHVTDVDATREWEPDTALWKAVCHGRAEHAAALLAAGANAWAPVVGWRSAGWLGLHTDFAWIFESLPDCVPLTDAEQAAQADADARTQVFLDVLPPDGGVSVVFVSGVSEEEAVRRLGSGPGRSPVLDLRVSPGLFGTGPGGFNPHGKAAERFLGVTGVDGGCVVFQPYGYRANAPAVLCALSPGTTAYGLFRSGVGHVYGRRSVDGHDEPQEEIGSSVQDDDPELRWVYRFWQWNLDHGVRIATQLAYASAMAGLRITDGAVVSQPPRRWVELPESSPLLG